MRFRTFNLFAGAGLLALVSTAGAQTRPDASLEEIIVTARRVEERLQDVPISMTVFNQEQLTRRNVVNASDLANYTPSLSANTNFGSENTSFAIRGFTQDAGTPPSVGVYFADVVAPRGASNGLQVGDGAGPGYFFDLQNVQVLKGPQGTLFGRNTTGGAILFVPKKPTSELEGYVEASGGNYAMQRIQGALNLPLSDTARFRIAVDHQSRDGYLNNTSGVGSSDLNDVSYTAVRASLVLDLTSNLENYTIASFSRSDTNGSLQKLVACDPTSSLGAAFACPQLARERANGTAGFYDVQSAITNPRSTLEQWQAINTTTWHASDTLTFKNIASYAHLRDNLRTSLFGNNWSAGPMHVDFATVQSPPGLDSAKQSTFTEELQMQGSAWDQRLTYQAGAYLETSHPLGQSGSQSPFLISCTSVETFQCLDVLGIGASAQFGFPIQVGAVNYTVGETKYHDVGVYTQSTYAITDQFKVTGGIRYTWDRQENSSTRESFRFPVTYPFTAPAQPVCTDIAQAFPGCSQTLIAKSEAPTWLMDFDYKPTDAILLYAQYKRGYRAGGVFANSPANYRVFDPEKVEAYEAGLKTSFRSVVSGTFNIAAFYNDFTSQQLQVGFDAVRGSGQSSTTGIVNAGKSRIQGIEVQASITPLEGLTFDASYTYLDTRIVSIVPLVSTDPNYTTGLKIEPGDPLVLSPRNKYTVSGEYTLPLPESIGRISLGATFIHSDKQLSNYVYLHTPANVASTGGNFGTLAPLDLLNLNVSWNSIVGAPVDISLFGTNVTQKKYYTFVPGLVTAGFESASIGEPRMFGARVRYRFGS